MDSYLEIRNYGIVTRELRISRVRRLGLSRKRVFITFAVVIVLAAAAVALLNPEGPTQRATDFNSPPYTRGIEVGRTYEYSLYTHCGIRQARIDGTNWRASPRLHDLDGNPLDGLSSDPGLVLPTIRGRIGTLKIVSANKAVYTLDNGRTATFVRDNLPRLFCR